MVYPDLSFARFKLNNFFIIIMKIIVITLIFIITISKLQQEVSTKGTMGWLYGTIYN